MRFPGHRDVFVDVVQALHTSESVEDVRSM